MTDLKKFDDLTPEEQAAIDDYDHSVSADREYARIYNEDFERANGDPVKEQEARDRYMAKYKKKA